MILYAEISLAASNPKDCDFNNGLTASNTKDCVFYSNLLMKIWLSPKKDLGPIIRHRRVNASLFLQFPGSGRTHAWWRLIWG